MAASAEHRLPLSRAGNHLAAAEDVSVLLRLRLGEGDCAALPLRSADAPRLEDLPAAQSHIRRPRVRMADAHEVCMKHWIRSFTLWDFVQAHWLTLKYFFRTKATINYPYE